MKVLIINYNRVTLPSKMADFVAECGLEPIFVDNNSDYLPLLEFYENTPYKVLRLKHNYGHKAIWDAGVLESLKIENTYIITDPDLDLTGIPKDFLGVLEEGLKRYPAFDKCGLSLETNDLPDTKSGKRVKNVYEASYWKYPLDAQYFRADIDTTFALYKKPFFSYTGIRTNRPYTARHLPWYYDHIKDLPEDEQYYFTTANSSSSGNRRIRR
jgi:hypothetical protein